MKLRQIVDGINRRKDLSFESIEENPHSIRESIGEKFINKLNQGLAHAVVTVRDRLSLAYNKNRFDAHDTKQRSLTAEKDRYQKSIESYDKKLVALEAKIATKKAGRHWDSTMAEFYAREKKELEEAKIKALNHQEKLSVKIENRSGKKSHYQERRDMVARRAENEMSSILSTREAQKSRLEEAEKQINSEIQEYQKQVDEFQKEYDQIKKEFSGASNRHERKALQRELGQIERELRCAKKDISRLERHRRPIDNDMRVLQTNISNIKHITNSFTRYTKTESAPEYTANIAREEAPAVRTENRPENDRWTYSGESEATELLVNDFMDSFESELAHLPDAIKNAITPHLPQLEKDLEASLGTMPYGYSRYSREIGLSLLRNGVRDQIVVQTAKDLTNNIFNA